MEEAMLYHHQELSINNKRMNEYMQNIVSNNNNYKCECCPYGHHVNVDFVEFAKDISNSHNELQKIRRYQRKLERAQNNLLNKSDVYSNFPKESIILSNQLSCSSSDSNSSDMVETNTKQNQDVANIVYIPNNLNDCTSQSSDDSNMQSLIVDNDDTDKGQCKTFTPSKSHSKNNSYSSKSFVVSYEHLMSIREQMSASLKRVQDLEAEVKNMHNLRQKVDSMTKENHQLKCELAHEKELREIHSTKTELNRKFNEIAADWCSISDLPNQLVPNLERLLNTKLCLKQTGPQKSRTTQTDVNGHTIVDTLSYFANNSDDICGPSCQKVRKRNFGVTVRPTHHNFSQQISPAPVPAAPTRSALNEQSLVLFLDWLKSCLTNDIDKRVGVVVYNVVSHFFSDSYHEAIELLKSQLQSFSHNYRVQEAKSSQTTVALAWNAGCQADIPSSTVAKSVQVVPAAMENKYVSTESVVSRDSSVGTHTFGIGRRDCPVQTEFACLAKLTQTDDCRTPVNDFASHYEQIVERTDFSSATDRYLIDDMIAEQIEKSIELIHNELRSEMEQSLRLRDQQQQLRQTMIIDNSCSSDSTYEALITSGLDCNSNSDPVVDTGIGSDRHGQRAPPNLERCGIVHSHFFNGTTDGDKDGYGYGDDSDQLPSKQTVSPDHTCRLHQSIITHVHEESIVQTSYSSNQSDSPGSSPTEATYYSMDGRVEYKTSSHMEEIEDLDEKLEDEENLNLIQSEHLDKLCMIIPNAIPVFPQEIQDACQLIALWMNDSTTTCSKDLNESLGTIRQFWFELTADISCNLKFYIDKFSGFNPTLQERIINMTDTNGNTCLHYAVSEGRWPIVRLLLQTRQVNVNKTNNAGYTVLMLVAVSESIDEESLKMLISDSQIDKQSLNDTQQTALMIAASQGKTKFVQLLLERGASVNITDSDGSTALMCACDNGHLEVVRLLLSRPDIDTESEDNTGCNAMKIALDNSHKDIALLIFARNNLQKISQKSKRRSGSSSHPTSPLNQRKFK